MSDQYATEFAGRTIVVSGASSGIGRAVAVHLGRQGAKLILIGRNRERLEATAKQVGASQCHIVEFDLRVPADVLPAIREAHRVFGQIYGLCHAAGTVTTLPLSATTPEVIQDMMQVNYVGGMELARTVCRREFFDQTGGSLLFISSIYAVIGKAGVIAYSGAKGAITAAARAMAVELARRNIRVNVLSLGMVRTEMTDKSLSALSPLQVEILEASHPLGFGTPEDAAHAAAFLLSNSSKWITGTDFVVDGGCSAH